jgi:carboxyl-terminal processing protease
MRIILYLFLCITPMCVYPQKTLKEKTIILKRFLEQQHYQPVKWDDSAAVLLYNKWMNSLDDEKLFFVKDDIGILETFKLKLDDELNGKEWGFFDKSMLLYKKRLQKTDSVIKVILAKPLDFSKPESIVWPFATYAANEQEFFQRWQQYLKWQLLRAVADDVADTAGNIPLSVPSNFAKLEADNRAQIRKNELGYIKSKLASLPAVLEDEYLDNIAWCYDPHTNYMNLAAKTEFETKMSASELSTGMDFDENEKGDLEINYLQPGGSAWRSGKINKGDVITKIKIDNIEKDVKELDEGVIDNYLNGSSQKEVDVTVRSVAGETKSVKLVKEKVADDESIVKSFVLRGQQNVGYIHLPGFYSRENTDAKYVKDLTLDGCANDVSKEIVKLKKDSVDGIILDLRNNGGGSMWEATQLAGIFIDLGPVASAKGKDGKVHFLKDPNRGSIYDGPLMVLINGLSASASEFLSATLQDYKRALIVGGTTYGKGTAQVVLPMDTTENPSKEATDFVKVTGSKFYRVSGSTTQWKGVEPDIAIPDLYDDEAYKEKANASALHPDNSKAGVFQQYTLPSIATLTEKSKVRVGNSAYFNTVKNFLQWYRQIRKGKTVTLQWNGYAKECMAGQKIFKDINDAVPKKEQLLVTNNKFDWQRILQLAEASKEINEVYIKNVKEDETILEGYRIMMDWIAK